MDPQLRKLERAASQGGAEEKAQYLAAMLRTGYPVAHVQAAAELNHVPSRLTLGLPPMGRRLHAALHALAMDPGIATETKRAIAAELCLLAMGDYAGRDRNRIERTLNAFIQGDLRVHSEPFEHQLMVLAEQHPMLANLIEVEALSWIVLDLQHYQVPYEPQREAFLRHLLPPAAV